MKAVARCLRIVGIAIGLLVAVTVSQRATLAREGYTLPGLSWALGALGAFFLVGAYATERTQGPDANVRKDLLWGLGAGCVLTILSRLEAP